MSDPPRRGVCRRGPALAVAMLAGIFSFGPLASASALEAGPEAAAVATQDGWWNRAQGPQEAEPENNPVRPVLPTVPAPPTVPDDALAVASALGEPAIVAAVGIRLTVPEEVTVESLTLTLTEVESGTTNAEGATVEACPAVTPWGGAKNAAWEDRPEKDCSLGQVEGVRGGDGTWTFDLTALARQWADPFAPLAQYGVVLGLDTETSPDTTQVAWKDLASGNVVVDLVASAVPEPTSPAAAPPPPPDVAGSPGPAADPAPAPQPAPGPGTARSGPLTFPTSRPSFDGPAASTDTGPEPAAEEASGTVPTPRSSARPTGTLQEQPAVGFWDVPARTLLLVPLALGLALLVSLALGPAGRPLPAWPRAGGLTRALARRSGGGGALA